MNMSQLYKEPRYSRGGYIIDPSSPRYTQWAKIHSHLKTRTELRRMKILLPQSAKPAAYKTGGYGPWPLFDLGGMEGKYNASPE